LEKQAKQLQGSLSKTASLPTTAAPQQTDETSRAWFTAKGLKSLRKRLGLSQADFAKLVDVSDQTVYQWEAKNGMLKLRGNTKATLVSVRNIGKVEARKRLEEKAGKAKKSVAKRKK
jgi:DNA-binding transcriptional regulator YiaG